MACAPSGFVTRCFTRLTPQEQQRSVTPPGAQTGKSVFRQPALRVYVAVRYPISLTPRFSEVHDRVCYRNRFSGFLVHWA